MMDEEEAAPTKGGEPDPGPGGEVPSHWEPGGEVDECMLGLRATSGMHFAKKAQNSRAAAAKAAAAPNE